MIMNKNIFTTFLTTTLAVGLSLMSASEAEAIVFGVKSRFIDSSSQAQNSYPGAAPANLFSFNENGGGFTNYGQLRLNGAGISVDGLAISANDGLFGFASNTSGSTLISITPGQSAVTAIGPRLNGRIIKGAVFQGDILWAIDSQQNELLRIDQNTGSILENKELILNGSPVNIANSSDIAIDNGGTFYYSVNRNTNYTFNVNTGEVLDNYIINSSGFANNNNNFAGLTFSDNAGEDIAFIAEANSSDDIRIANLTTSTQTALFNNIYSGYNAGPMDLAAVVTVTQPVPEPLTILGSLTALGFGTSFKREISKKKNLKQDL